MPTENRKPKKKPKTPCTSNLFGDKQALALKDQQLRRVMAKIDALEAQAASEGKKMKRGTIKQIVDQERKVLPWMTMAQIYSIRQRRVEKKRKAQEKEEIKAFEIAQEAALELQLQGSTKEQKDRNQELKKRMIDDITLTWLEAILEENNSIQLWELIRWKQASYNLRHVEVSERTIRSRIRRYQEKGRPVTGCRRGSRAEP